MSKEQRGHARFYESWTFLLTVCILLPLVLRTFLYSPFHIPSGSMKSTLLIGDYIFVSKFSYGYSRYSFPLSPDLFEGRVWKTPPERGDVIVFRLPTNPRVDYIKRLVGLPGDAVAVKDGVLFLNGEPVLREKVEDFIDYNKYGEPYTIPRYKETLSNGVSYHVLDQGNNALDNVGPYYVPEGHYFFMGDNRDNSQDSRVLELVGYVPEKNLVGRAEVVFFSSEKPFWRVWEWIGSLRGDRFLKKVGLS